MSTGSLIVAGLGPGADGCVTPEVTDALAAATDILGYAPYVARVAPRAGRAGTGCGGGRAHMWLCTEAGGQHAAVRRSRSGCWRRRS